MNLRGWISTIGLGVLMTGCAVSGTAPDTSAAARLEARQVAQALLRFERVQALATTEKAALDPEASKARLYRALGAERREGTYQALKAVLAR